MGFPACCHADEGGMIKTPNTSLLAPPAITTFSSWPQTKSLLKFLLKYLN